MKSRVCRLYGKNDLKVEQDEVHLPKGGQVLVRLAYGGICGSDMHYLADGGIGTIKVQEPIILGHEASGRIIKVGDSVDGLEPEDVVAINPSRPCSLCKFCTEGLFMHCLEMRFNGSAIRLPHQQGLFRDLMVLEASQCIRVPPDTDLAALACSEPLAVCLHAAKMAGTLSGKRVLITGAGPIGALCTAVAAKSGADTIIVTDIYDNTLKIAKEMGATECINVALHPDKMERYTENKGYFDTVFECSAVSSAIKTAVETLLPRGCLIQVGVAGDTPVPINAIVAKEIKFQGIHRFHEEFNVAVRAITNNNVDVRPILSGVFELKDIEKAFSIAMDRSKSVKVQLKFN